MADDTASAVRRRRNGRLQACDPCHRQKLACDHARPCARCVKKQNEGACVYTEQAPAPKRLKSAAALSSSSSHHDRSPGTASPAGRPSASGSGLTGGVGYLGYTSFDTVYEETRTSLSLLGAPSRPGSGTAHPPVESLIPTERLPRTQKLCLGLLHMIPTPRDGKTFSTGPYAHDSWVHEAALQMVEGLYSVWGDYLHANRRIERLEEMARVVSANSARDVVDDSPDPVFWISQFTGASLRWEAVGIMLLYWHRGQSSHAEQRDMINDCLEICAELTPAATIWTLQLHNMRCTLQSLDTGDASLAVCHYQAKTISLVTFRGLHVENLPQHSQHRPTMPSEFRRRLLWTCFTLDKVLVAFTGRPPRLTRHYVTTAIPLDLSDDALFADEHTLAHAVSTKLDGEGWNTDGAIYSSTMIRARALLAVLLDEVFEIALGSQAATVPMERLLEIRSRTEQTYAGLPTALRYSADESPGLRLTFSKLLIRLEYLQCLFILDRLAQKRHHHSEDSDLLGVSYEMASLVVGLWTRMDKFGDVKKDFAWVVMGYGGPAGGVLCLELLRPTLLHGGSGGGRSSSSSSRHRDITRSGITQTLSLLVGFLDWVDKDAPNGDICEKTKSTIQQVLDQALNGGGNGYGGGGGIGQGQGQGQGQEHGHQQAVDVAGSHNNEHFGWEFGTQFDFNFDLMDTFDWLRSEPSLSQEHAG